MDKVRKLKRFSNSKTIKLRPDDVDSLVPNFVIGAPHNSFISNSCLNRMPVKAFNKIDCIARAHN